MGNKDFLSFTDFLKIWVNWFWDEHQPFFLINNKVVGRSQRICLLSDLPSFLMP